VALAVESGQPLASLKECTPTELDAFRRVLEARKMQQVQARQQADAVREARRLAGRL